MADLLKELGGRVKALAEGWGAYVTVGSFALYVVGYLSVRFYLTALGIATEAEAEALDKRYVYQGAKFLVQVVPLIPALILLAGFLFGLLYCTLYLPYRVLLPGVIRKWLQERAGKPISSARTWWSHPDRLMFTGTLLSLFVIRVLRDGFEFHDLLLLPRLPSMWLTDVLLDTDLPWVYFAGMLTGTGLCGLLFWGASKQEQQTSLSRPLRVVFAGLLGIQVLLLAANHGILLADKFMFEVSKVPTQESLGKCQKAWLVWQGKEWWTYLLRDVGNGKDRRALLSVRKSDVKTVEVTSADSILQTLFGKEQATCSAPADGGPKPP